MPGGLVTNEELVAKIGLNTFAQKSFLIANMAALHHTFVHDQAGNGYIDLQTSESHLCVCCRRCEESVRC
jgi:hypothetical protein